MKELIAGKFIEKKSRFYTHLYTIAKISEVDQILSSHRTEYKKANHHCYAYILFENNTYSEKYHDDGEVGHPGKVLIDVLKKNQLDHHLIVISRIFGGIKLGVGGVSKAFKQAAEETISYYNDQTN
jgi:putative IMPACT (imprinted ancient) family translation regulator